MHFAKAHHVAGDHHHQSENQKGAHLRAFSHNELRKIQRLSTIRYVHAITRTTGQPAMQLFKLWNMLIFLTFWSPPRLCGSKMTSHPDNSFPSVEPLE